MSDLSNRMREIANKATVAPSQGPEVCTMRGVDFGDQPKYWRCALGDGVLSLCAEIEDLEAELAYERDARRLRVKQTSFAHGGHPEGWSVYNENDRRLSRSGDWDYQPLPSSRSAEWIAEHSWPTMRAAVDAARKAEAK